MKTLQTEYQKPSVWKKNGFLMRLLIFLIVFLGFSAAGIAWINSDSTPPPGIAELHEGQMRFDFEVRYGFLRLGDVHVIQSDTTVNGKDYTKLTAVMISNRNLPFVGYKEYHYNSLLVKNDSTFYSTYFWVDKIHREQFPYNSFEFDYEAGKVYSYELPSTKDTLDLNGPSDGGPALFLLSRAYAGKDHEMTYPVFVNNKENVVELKFTSETDRIRSPVFDGDRVNVYKSSGNARLEGPFGFSGQFTSLHHTGDLRLPLEARASVWIGNVLIRLQNYEKK